MFDYFFLLAPRIWVARDQTQPGPFSQEREEPGNEVAIFFENEKTVAFSK